MTTLDVTAVYDQDGEQAFAEAVTMRVQVGRNSKVMEHPLEDGSSVIDHRVVLPVEAMLVLILPAEIYKDLYSVIQGYFLAGELLTVQTKVRSFDNMFISEMPHEETPEMSNVVQMLVRMKEAVFFKSQVQAIAPRNTKSVTTSKRGEQAPRSSVAYDIFN